MAPLPHPANRKVLVSVRSLCKDFTRPNGSRFTVLEGIHLDVYDGEFLAILGLSGSGKSTLLNCMAGLMEPDRGQVSFAPALPGYAQPASFVFQNYALFPWLTVRENMEMALQRTTKAQRKEKVDKMLDLVGLWGFEDAYPRELSGGMKQRVSVCRALVAEPMVMFMDEPFSNLDPLSAQSMRSELERIWMLPERKLRAIVLVTHLIDEALQLADRVIILSSKPGTVFRSIEIPLPRHRSPNDPKYADLETLIERSFGELHLDKTTDENHALVNFPTTKEPPVPGGAHVTLAEGASRSRRTTLRPIINTSLVLVEGLVNRLSQEEGQVDLYDLADDMGQSVDTMMPAVAAAETLGLIFTPGVNLVLTQFGKEYTKTLDPIQRRNLLRDSCMRIPLFVEIIDLVDKSGDEGLSRDAVVSHLSILLPFEDPEIQFEGLIKWARHVDLLDYDTGRRTLTLGGNEEPPSPLVEGRSNTP